PAVSTLYRRAEAKPLNGRTQLQIAINAEICLPFVSKAVECARQQLLARSVYFLTRIRDLSGALTALHTSSKILFVR
ncbi:MAG: hypothetical protein M3458_10990, partial [Acidobacteriota bacterium]|nr:hypothetical protein [Acidobacteriota bacterium]